MVASIGDRISIDALKVGQPRRTGTIREVSEGLAGRRYVVSWDDGHTTSFAPAGGNLIIEAKRAAKKR